MHHIFIFPRFSQNFYISQPPFHSLAFSNSTITSQSGVWGIIFPHIIFLGIHLIHFLPWIRVSLAHVSSIHCLKLKNFNHSHVLLFSFLDSTFHKISPSIRNPHIIHYLSYIPKVWRWTYNLNQLIQILWLVAICNLYLWFVCCHFCVNFQ